MSWCNNVLPIQLVGHSRYSIWLMSWPSLHPFTHGCWGQSWHPMLFHLFLYLDKILSARSSGLVAGPAAPLLKLGRFEGEVVNILKEPGETWEPVILKHTVPAKAESIPTSIFNGGYVEVFWCCQSDFYCWLMGARCTVRIWAVFNRD